MDYNDLLTSIANDIGDKCQYYSWKPTVTQQAFIDDKSPAKGAIGSNRSGKTATQGYIIGLLADGKYKIRDNEPKKHYEVLYVSLTTQMSRTIAVPAIKKFVPEAWIDYSESKSEMLIRSDSGIEVLVYFRSLEQGREKVQGLSIDLLILDEQIDDENFYNECVTRTLDAKGQTIMGFTALLGSNFQTDLPIPKYCFKMTDNPIISKAEIESLFKNMSAQERAIRVDGAVLDLAGNKYLQGDSRALISAIFKESPKFTRQLHNFTVEYFSEDIYDDLIYTAGADVATGSGNDFSTFCITATDWTGRCEVVLLAYSNTASTPQFEDLIMELATEFGLPPIQIEASGIGISIVQHLLAKGYPSFARRKDADMRFVTEELGFKTTGVSREFALSEFQTAIVNKQFIPHSSKMADELLKYSYMISNRRYDHPPSGHDDCLWAGMMAYLCSRSVNFPEKPKPVLSTKEAQFAEELKRAIEAAKTTPIDTYEDYV